MDDNYDEDTKDGDVGSVEGPILNNQVLSNLTFM